MTPTTRTSLTSYFKYIQLQFQAPDFKRYHNNVLIQYEHTLPCSLEDNWKSRLASFLLTKLLRRQESAKIPQISQRWRDRPPSIISHQAASHMLQFLHLSCIEDGSCHILPCASDAIFTSKMKIRMQRGHLIALSQTHKT